MPYSGPETVVSPPPLAAPPTGLLQSATIIEHPMLDSPGNLAFLVGPDAPDTVLASAILSIADRLFGPIDGPDPETVHKAAVMRVETLTAAATDVLYDTVLEVLTAAPRGGMELGGDGGPDPLDHWMAGIRWLPEPHLGLELVDPCTNTARPMATFDGGRVVTDGVTATDTSLVSQTASFSAMDVGRTVSGTGIQAATTIITVTDSTTVILSQATTASASGVTVLIQPTPATVTGASRKTPVAGQPFLTTLHDSCSTFGWMAADYVGRAQRGLAPRETIAVEQEFMHGSLMGASRVVADGATNTNTTITSATLGFSKNDIGRPITGTGIPAGTVISAVTNATTATISKAATATATGVTFTLGSVAGGSNRYLSDQNCVVYTLVSAFDPNPIQALAYANEAIARAGIGQGMIHVSAFFVEAASALGYTFVKDNRGRLTTLNGNIVVPGNGYDGIGPDGTGGPTDDSTSKSGHTHEWIYVSDLPVVWRSPAAMIFPASLREATNMALNEVTFRAQRPYIVAWSALLQVAIKCNILAVPT